MKYTTIRISLETKAKIIALGKKGDSYETIIARLIAEHK